MSNFKFQINGTTLSCVDYPTMPSFKSQEEQDEWMDETAEEMNNQAHNFLVEQNFENAIIYGLPYGWQQKIRENNVIIIETNI